MQPALLATGELGGPLAELVPEAEPLGGGVRPLTYGRAAQPGQPRGSVGLSQLVDLQHDPTFYGVE